jgi:hypothetical protein
MATIEQGAGRGRRSGLALIAAFVAALAMSGSGASATPTWSWTALDYFDYCAMELDCQSELRGGELARTGDRSAVVIWTFKSCVPMCVDDPDPTYHTNQATTVDTGLTWSRRDLGWGAVAPTIASRGALVDALYVHGGSLIYRRSADGGATWRAPRVVSPASDDPFQPLIARGPAGRVAIAWRDRVTGQSRVATSTNSGMTFGPPRTIGANDILAVAIGGPTVYVAYYRAPSGGLSTLRVRRSPDAGATWPAGAISVISDSARGASLAADAQSAIVGYRDAAGAPIVRRTTNAGLTWGPRLALATGSRSAPRLETSKGIWRTAFERCAAQCLIRYRRSIDAGATWGPASTVGSQEATALDVGAATKPLVLVRTSGGYVYELGVYRGP